MLSQVASHLQAVPSLRMGPLILFCVLPSRPDGTSEKLKNAFQLMTSPDCCKHIWALFQFNLAILNCDSWSQLTHCGGWAGATGSEGRPKMSWQKCLCCLSAVWAVENKTNIFGGWNNNWQQESAASAQSSIMCTELTILTTNKTIN